MAAAKTEMILPALQISEPLSFPHSPMDNYPKLEEVMMLSSTGTPFLTASAPEGAGFGSGEPGEQYDHLAGDTLPDIPFNCEKSVGEQTYSTQRLPPISYTGRFTLEPATTCSNSLWAEPILGLFTGLMGNIAPSSSSAASQTTSSSSSSIPSATSSSSTSSSQSLSSSIHHSEPNPIYSAAPTYSSPNSDIFPDQGQVFSSSAGTVQYPPPAYPNGKTCNTSFPVPMIPDYLFPQQQGEISLVPPDQKPFQSQSSQPSLTPLSTIKAFATQTGSQDLKSVYQRSGRDSSAGISSFACLQLPFSHHLLPLSSVFLPFSRHLLLLLSRPHFLSISFHRHHLPISVNVHVQPLSVPDGLLLPLLSRLQHLQLSHPHPTIRHADHSLPKDNRDLLRMSKDKNFLQSLCTSPFL
ncbi:hypothetical protein FQN60_010349, partial [Etheostoma spectabile]